MNAKLRGLGLSTIQPHGEHPEDNIYRVSVITQAATGILAVYLEEYPNAVLFIKPMEQLAMLDLGGRKMLLECINLHAKLLVETFARQLYFGLNTRDLGERFE